MKFFAVVLLFGVVFAAEDKFSHQQVFDWMKVLTNPEIYALISQKFVQWPTYDKIPEPSFSCSDKKYPGFYAGT